MQAQAAKYSVLKVQSRLAQFRLFLFEFPNKSSTASCPIRSPPQTTPHNCQINACTLSWQFDWHGSVQSKLFPGNFDWLSFFRPCSLHRWPNLFVLVSNLLCHWVLSNTAQIYSEFLHFANNQPGGIAPLNQHLKSLYGSTWIQVDPYRL